MTKELAHFILEKMKIEKGIDIQRNSYYMNVLMHECEAAKISLSEDTEDIGDREAFIRIADLPDDSTYGKMVLFQMFNSIIKACVEEIAGMVEKAVSRHKGIQKVLLHGNASKMVQIKQALKS